MELELDLLLLQNSILHDSQDEHDIMVLTLSQIIDITQAKDVALLKEKGLMHLSHLSIATKENLSFLESNIEFSRAIRSIVGEGNIMTWHIKAVIILKGMIEKVNRKFPDEPFVQALKRSCSKEIDIAQEYSFMCKEGYIEADITTVLQSYIR
jgi:hypothetical protein